MWLFKDMHLVAWPLLLGAVAINYRRGSVLCPRWLMRGAIGLLHGCVAAIASYVAAAWLRPHFNEWVEHGVVAVARYWNRGGDVYPAPAVMAKFGLYPYGPLLFQMIGTASHLLGGSNRALKGLAVLVTLGVYGWVFWLCRRQGSGLAPSALVVELLAVSVGIMGFMVKADILLIWLAALGCGLVALRPGRLSTGIMLAVLAGLASAIKIHGALYILPASVEFLATRRGLRVRYVAIGCAIALCVAMLPFLVPRTSLDGYLYVLSTASRDGLLPGIFISNVDFLATCVLAVHALTQTALRDAPYRRLMVSVLCAGGVVSVFAAKSEAGPHHLIPFLPYLCLPLARALSVREAGAARALMLVLFVVSFQPVTSIAKDILLMSQHWNQVGALI